MRPSTSAVERLRRAIARGELDASLERTLHLRTATVSAVEASARWLDDRRGFVDPAEFTALAERHGIVYPLGACVRRCAVERMQEWYRRGRVSRATMLWLKVSPHELERPELIGELFALRVVAGDHPIGVALVGTVTELDRSRLAALRSMTRGDLPLALPDLGEPARHLLAEHDRSTLRMAPWMTAGVVDDYRARRRVADLVGIARSVGCSVTATAVETPAEYAAMRDLGCDYAHGLLASQPGVEVAAAA